jgi:hypothetical protein
MAKEPRRKAGTIAGLYSRLPKLRSAAVAVLMISLWIVGVLVWSHSTLHSNTPKANPKVVSPHQIAHDSLLEELYPDDNADSYQTSLLSCYDECKAGEIPPTKIGILFPPGSMGLMLVDYIQMIVRVHSSRRDNEVIWIPTSHLPPDPQFYSHIIRFANLPILLTVGDGLLDVAKPEEITWVDVEEAAELFVSWHCWISRLAGQQTTPMVTLTMQMLEESPLEAETLLRDFLTIMDPYSDDPEGHVDTGEMGNSIQQMVDVIKKPLLKLDKQLRKQDKNKNLEVVVNHVIRKYLTEESQCPSGGAVDLFVPKSRIAKRLHDVVQIIPAESSSSSSSQYEADVDRCKHDAALSERLFCKGLSKPFSIKSLLQGKKRS